LQYFVLLTLCRMSEAVSIVFTRDGALLLPPRGVLLYLALALAEHFRGAGMGGLDGDISASLILISAPLPSSLHPSIHHSLS
jgi:hypothetical protein